MTTARAYDEGWPGRRTTRPPTVANPCIEGVSMPNPTRSHRRRIKSQHFPLCWVGRCPDRAVQTVSWGGTGNAEDIDLCEYHLADFLR